MRPVACLQPALTDSRRSCPTSELRVIRRWLGAHVLPTLAAAERICAALPAQGKRCYRSALAPFDMPVFKLVVAASWGKVSSDSTAVIGPMPQISLQQLAFCCYSVRVLPPDQ